MCPNRADMRYMFLSSLLALGLTATSQVPDYVPADGLVAWYPFNGNADDAGMNGYDGTSVGVEFVEDRHNVDNSAIRCGYPDSPTWVELPQSLQTSSMDFTLSFWLKPASVSGRSEVVSRDQDPQDDGDWSFFIEDGVLFFETRIGNGPTNFVSGGIIETSSWSNVVVRRSASTGENQIYLNGLLVATAEEFYGSLNPSNPIHIGRHAVVASIFYQGDFDDFGIWNRALSLEEISSLNTGEQPVFGCTNDNACNFNPEANVDDGSCVDASLIAAFGTDMDSISTCLGEVISLSAAGIAPPLDSTLLDAFTMTVNGFYSRTTPVLESGHSYRLIGNGRYGFADGWSHNDPAWNYAWDEETGTKVNCNGTQDASEDVRWLFDGNANFQRPDNDYHNNDNNAFCNGSDKTYAWTIEGDGEAHIISWEDCCYGDNSGSLDFWLYELTGASGGPESTWSTGGSGTTIEWMPTASQWVTLTATLDGLALCQDSIWIQVATGGCNDQDACNFNLLDECATDCVYPLLGDDCEAGAVACATGTIWDPESQLCIVANPSDTNFDGCVSMTDLLDLLTVFGTCNEVPWSCGDSLEYQGYDYETIQIGEQCWFAENLRSENYENGDAIPSNLSDGEWSSTNSGAVAVYGEGSSSCNTYSPDGDACDPNWSLAEYGRLYNWYAVDDERGLCPNGWSTPGDDNWQQMVQVLGGDEVAGSTMKSQSGWDQGGNGTNSSGFNATPAGLKVFDGGFLDAGWVTYWWTSSAHQIDASYNRSVNWPDGDVSLSSNDNNYGFSIRCMKDSE